MINDTADVDDSEDSAYMDEPDQLAVPQVNIWTI